MNNKIYRLSIKILFGILLAVLAVFLLKNSFSYSDVDLGWHLRIGKDIIASQQAPRENPYNYTLSGQTWVDHEWLLNWLMASVFDTAGFLGLQLLFLLPILGAVIFAWLRSRRLDYTGKLGRYFCLFWIFLGLWASRPHLGLRVQEFGLFGLSFLFYLFAIFPKRRRWLWLLPVFFCLWANSHGSFLLGLAVVGAYFFYAISASWWRRWPWFRNFTTNDFSLSEKKQLGAVFLLSLAATLINPYGLGLYAFLGGYANTFYMSHIREWQSQFALPLCYPQLLYLALALDGAVLFFLGRRYRTVKIPFWDLAWSAFFFILAFRSRRHFPIFVIISLPVLTAFYQDEIKIIGRRWSRFWRPIFILAVIIGSIVFIVYQTSRLPWRQDGINFFCGTRYPCAAVFYLRSRPELANRRLFNEYSWGGFLLWAYPEKPLFIDGRMPQAAYRGHTILEEYADLRSKKDDSGKLLDDYSIDLVLINAQDGSIHLKPWEKLIFSITNEELSGHNYLREYLSSSPDWQLAFQDKLSLVYVRKR